MKGLRWAAPLTLATCTLALVACGGGGGAAGPGDANRGKTLFESKACITCHTLPGIASATGTVGPPLAGIANTAGTRKPGMSAEAYIRESIENPNAFVVPGFPSPSPMPPGQAAGQELADLVAFLLAQR